MFSILRNEGGKKKRVNKKSPYFLDLVISVEPKIPLGWWVGLNIFFGFLMFPMCSHQVLNAFAQRCYQ